MSRGIMSVPRLSRRLNMAISLIDLNSKLPRRVIKMILLLIPICGNQTLYTMHVIQAFSLDYLSETEKISLQLSHILQLVDYNHVICK